MKNLIQLKNVLNKEKQEVNTVRTLFFAMEKVGGYSVLCGEEWEEEYSFWKFKIKKKVTKKGISLGALQEIIKCMEWENMEKNKQTKRKR